jgi:formylglycine-generating enzyme required for sulfatase activity
MSLRLCWSLCTFFIVLMLTSLSWSQQRASQVALVIGNANYLDASGALPTPVKDARALAEEARRNNFDVDLKENLNKSDMQRAIDAFTGKIGSGTVALFYFSGFGIQVGRQTYLIPVNAQIWSEEDTKRDGINLDDIVAEMHRKGARVKIVIIDASRRNPFERRFRSSPAGIAALSTPQNTLAIYSAAPGAVINDAAGDTSAFVNALITEMRTPNVTAEDVFNRTRINVSRASNSEQIPWVASSLVDEFSFGGAAKVAATPAPATPPSSSPPAQAAPPPQPPATVQTPAPDQVQKRPADAAPRPGATAQNPPDAQRASPPAPTKTEVGKNPGDTFRDCAECGELVVIPAGTFTMGSGALYESPMHKITIAKPFAIGRFEVTFDEWDRCVTDKGCKFKPDDRGLGRGNRPVDNVSWVDVKEFLGWLSSKSGKIYRLPSEAEWEYVARGGTTTSYWWGRDVGQGQANCKECGSASALGPMPVGSFKPNPFGVFDTAGNAAEWVEDCWNDSYRGAPQDGSAWTTGQCNWRVLRGGAYDSPAKLVASSSRFRYDNDVRYPANGFRVLRELQ